MIKKIITLLLLVAFLLPNNMPAYAKNSSDNNVVKASQYNKLANITKENEIQEYIVKSKNNKIV